MAFKRASIAASLTLALALAGCGSGGTNAGGSAGIRCDMNVPPDTRNEGREFTEARQRANEAGERARISRERGRLAKACAEANGFTGIDSMRTVRPGPDVMLVDGTRGARNETAWLGIGQRDGARVRVLVTESGELTSAPFN